MTSSNSQSKNQEMQLLLQKMIHQGVCSKQNAFELWQKWLKMTSLSPLCPKKFLASQGFSQQIFSNQTKFNPHTTTGAQPSANNDNPKRKFGNYEIIEEIARGGMGVVYKVYQPEMRRYAALKVLNNASQTDMRLIRRFFREAKVTAALKHPNIIPIYEMSNIEGQNYFVMKHVNGGDFEDFIKQDHSLNKLIEILIKVCRALDHTHSHNVLHRDIKPSNILLDESHEPYLADFGLAKTLDSKSMLTQTGATIGTAYYMAPEQIESKNVTPLIDIYAIGVMLYLILTKELPFLADTPAALYRKILTEQPTLPRKIDSKIPQNLQHICLKCLQKNPTFRYQKPGLIADDLQSYLENKDVVLRESSIRIRLLQLLSHKYARVILAIICTATIAFSIHTFVARQQNHSVEISTIYQKAEQYFYEGKINESLKLLLRIANDNSLWETHALLGKVYLKKNNRSLALKHIDQSFRIADTPQVRYLKALLYYRENQSSKALNYLNKSISSHKYSELYRLRSLICKKTQPKLAKQDTTQAQKLEQQMIQNLQKSIEQPLSDKQWGKALSRLKTAERNYPSCEYIYVQKSHIYFAEQQYEEAISAINEAIKLHTTDEYRLLKSKYLRRAGYFRRALLLLEKISSQQKPLFYREYAKTLFKLKKMRLAKEAYQVITAEEYTKQDHVFLAKISIELRNYNAAKKHLESLITEYDKDDEVLYYYAYCLYEEYQYQQAEKYITKALEYNKKIPRAKLKLLQGKCYHKMQKFSLSLTAIKEAQTNLSKDVQLYNVLGEIYQHQKNYEKAVTSFSKCIELQPWNDAFYQKRGVVYGKQKNYAASQKDLLKVMSLNPQNYDPLGHLFKQAFENPSIRQQDSYLRSLVGVGDHLYRRIKIDLLGEEKQNLTSLYLEQNNLLKLGNTNEKHIKQFIDTLCSMNNKEVATTAITALISMAHSPKVLEKIQNKINTNPRNFLLKKAYKSVKRRYIQIQSTRVKALLVRYYVARDNEALLFLYRFNDNANILYNILLDEEENDIVRYFSARALKDLKTVPTYELLQELRRGNNTCAFLLSSLALGKNDAQIQHLQKTPNNSLIKTIIAKHSINPQLLIFLLQDKNLLVRLAAAKRLWEQGNNAGETLLVKHFRNPNVFIRRYCYFHFWTLEAQSLQKHKERITQQYQTHLLDGLNDKDENVKRICLMKTAYIDSTICLKKAYQLTHDKSLFVRFQALTTIGIKGDVETCAAFGTKPNEHFLIKLPALLAVRMNKKNKKKNLLNFMKFINHIFAEENSDIRVLLMRELGGALRGLGNSFLLKNLNHSNSYNRVGALLGLANSKRDYSKLAYPLLENDPNLTVRSAASLAIVLGLGANNRWQELKKYHTIIKKKSYNVREAAALAYSDLVVKNNERHKHTLKTGVWNEKQVYQKYIERIIEKFSERNEHEKKRSLRILKLSLDLTPQDSEYLFRIGLFYFVNKKFEKCKTFIQKALDQKNNNTVYQLWLAKAQYRSDEYKKALQTVEKILYQDPWDKNALGLKIRILRALGENEKEKAAHKRWQLF
ncbi:protein kinase [Candidatus Uabimicrobium sp. HlEnr_7]|uniref:protein kinase domain-containing protein n=1 Tax=Candidatus Uabimicrobium helgolandensis TaxID=3095367 RepID=UPI0035576D34